MTRDNSPCSLFSRTSNIISPRRSRLEANYSRSTGLVKGGSDECPWCFIACSLKQRVLFVQTGFVSRRSSPHYPHNRLDSLPTCTSADSLSPGCFRAALDASTTPYNTPDAHRAKPASVTATLWDEVGALNRTVSRSESDSWHAELHHERLSTRRQAVLHLRYGEYEMAAHDDPERAGWHFRRAQQLTRPDDTLHGMATYNLAVAQYSQCAFADATRTFRDLLNPSNHMHGFVANHATLWYRHALACEGYHAAHAALGIPQPSRLDLTCSPKSVPQGK